MSRYFSLSYYLQVSISSSIIAQNCQTYIQNIIEYALKVNYFAKNIDTCVIACKNCIMHLSVWETCWFNYCSDVTAVYTSHKNCLQSKLIT